MSSGGIFKLIINEGKQDKLLLASTFLKHRLKKIRQFNVERAAHLPENLRTLGFLEKSYIPDINAINKTHCIIVNNSFKPFVSTGFEYNKVQANGNIRIGQHAEFVLPVFGDFVNDAVVHVKLSGLRAVSPLDRVRYVAYPGHKLFKKVSFKVNANPLDNYVSDDYNAHYQFNVPPEKKIGWMRNVGQEIPYRAFLTADPINDNYREYKTFGDGFQTPKQNHDDLEMWIPLLFWFNEVQCSLPNALLPHGQSRIRIDLADATDIIGFADYGGGGSYITPTITAFELYTNHIFMNPEVVDVFIKKFGFMLIRVHLRHITRVFDSEKSVLLNELKWPVETIYATFRPKSNSSLSQYWNSGAALSLVEIKTPVVAQDSATTVYGNFVSSTDTTAVITGTSGAALSGVDGFYVGYTLKIVGGAGFNQADILVNNYTITAYNGTTNTVTVSGWNLATNSTTLFELFTPQLAVNVAQYYKETPAVDTIGIKAHGIPIYKATPESFYNSYIPQRFGVGNTPADRGWYMINFKFNPGEHQPSGYVNISKAREFYLDYTSSYINKDNETVLSVYAKAINFLLVDAGTAVLRYT